MIAELRTDTELERQIAADWLCEYGTEADWNRLLDQYHSDQQLRRRFGEWLLEKGEGYLALSACGKDCYYPSTEQGGSSVNPTCPYWSTSGWSANLRMLPLDWYELIEFEGKDGCDCPNWYNNAKATREELEEAAAVAFLLLSEDRRAELLAGKL